jgi:serine protease Do
MIKRPVSQRSVWRWAPGLVSALLVVSSLGAVAWADPAQKPFWTERASPGPALVGPDVKTFAPLVESASLAVVNIEVRYDGGEGSPGKGQGQGSGFLITPDGYALTNNHVIAGASEIVVTMADDRRFVASVVGADESTDVALVKLHEAEGLPVLPLGDSERLLVGDWVVAIGSPLGLRSTVTAGIVSATGRREVKPGNRRFYSNFIQTDASINPGNSGGPLLNTQGEVIGINTAINKEGQGIGFAIPVNMIKTILPALRSRGFVERSWIGIMIQPLDEVLARSFGLHSAQGAIVTDVVKGGPGERAGLASGDVILEFNREMLHSDAELPWLASVAGVGKTVPVTVWRGGKRKTVQMTLEPLPGQSARSPLAVDVARKTQAAAASQDVGIVARDLPRNQSVEGALVVKIEEDSPARASGLRPGDIVVSVNDREVPDARNFYQAVEEARALIRVKVKRSGSTFFFAFPR